MGSIFVNVIGGEYYHLVDSLDLSWFEHSLLRGGRDVILFIDNTYYYRNSNIEEVHTIDDIKRIIDKMESTTYRSNSLKKLTLNNYNMILDTLKKHDRQKKLESLVP